MYSTLTSILSITLLCHGVVAIPKQQVLDCIQTIESSFNTNPQNVYNIIDEDMAERLGQKLPKEFTKLCADVPAIAKMTKMRKNHKSAATRQSSQKTKHWSRESRRLLQSTNTCTNDGSALCEASSPSYTSGEDYDAMLELLQKPDVSGLDTINAILPSGDRTKYTEGDAVAKLMEDLNIAERTLGAAAEACDVAINCAGIDPTGAAVCGAATACALTVKTAQLLTDAIHTLLDKADLQDGLVMSTQLQAVFDDRPRVISNQKYIVKLINNKFEELTALLIAKFDDLTELNKKLFNLQNEWIDIKFDDTFHQLDSIEQLIKTPSGQRPGWNRQDLQDLFVEPTNISVPHPDDQFGA